MAVHNQENTLDGSEITFVTNKVRAWLEQTIIGFNFCPFAKSVYIKNQVRFTVSEAKDVDMLLRDLCQELQLLAKTDPSVIDTSLLIHPWALVDFLDYNDFLEVADAALVELDLEGIFQIASFHPNYQFEGTQPEDVENLTNRSPYPILHILREASVEQAIESHSDADSIPEQNVKRLKGLGQADIQKLKSLL